MQQTHSYRFEDWMTPELAQYLPEQQRELVQDSLDLLRFHGLHRKLHQEHEQGQHNCNCPLCTDCEEFHDYAFLVFPAAKAFEGFLKYLLFELHIISKERYQSRDLRIGRSLNPDLPPRLRNEEWYFDDLARLCSPEVARGIWDLWLEGRNHLFHYFPTDRYTINYHQAVELIQRIIEVMEVCRKRQQAHDPVIE